jgi:Co/Zn/Cd efflux system component
MRDERYRRILWIALTVNLAMFAVEIVARVWLSGCHWPDIVVAVIVAALALSAALRITRQARAEMRATTIAPAE